MNLAAKMVLRARGRGDREIAAARQHHRDLVGQQAGRTGWPVERERQDADPRTVQTGDCRSGRFLGPADLLARPAQCRRRLFVVPVTIPAGKAAEVGKPKADRQFADRHIAAAEQQLAANSVEANVAQDFCRRFLQELPKMPL